ncbi:class I SAM-dependent methyltransferase [Fodinibius sediminis]|uniref:O-Methyltransferase involved in polyketide biosynthesis n=1 Tax=Fodinibius sediminis TaxID=1214077 RepID=A0A521B0R0_9BACT|nr:class I SAM-dependent methyltransferase [Fodinibius sediminis]SMO40683.1 O-Methyltransferase involved in polyketide biosynthesis [Fodinibius sediminis]
MKPDQLSPSASFIAVKFFGLTREPEFRDLFDTGTVRYYEKICASLPSPLHYYHYWLRFRWVRSLYIKIEELLLPGDLLHILARKWYLRRLVDRLLSEGYEQVFVLGAGFDHLGLHYARRGLPSLELDTPRMIRLKKMLLDRHYPAHPHPALRPLHLPRQSLSDFLRQQHCLSAMKKTVVIAEGFFDYLQKAVVDDILSTLKNYFSSPALVSTHFALNELPPAHRWVFRTSLKIAGEHLQFDASMEEFQALLQDHQFRLQQKMDREQMKQELFSTLHTRLDLLKGFYIFSTQ